MLVSSVVFISIACNKDDDDTQSQSSEAYSKEAFDVNDAIFSSNGQAVTEMSLKVSSTCEVYIGDSVSNKATAYNKCTWKSSNENVVSISTTKGNKITLTAKSIGDAIISVMDEASKKTLSLKVVVDSEYTADIDYNLSMMADLLQFVSPEVVVMEDGVEKYKYALSESDFVAQDSLEYNDNGVIKRREMPKEWAKTIHYQRWGLKTDMIVRYIPKQNVTMDKESYDFYRGLSWVNAKSKGPSFFGSYTNISISINLNINITDNGVIIKLDNDGKILKESVADYVQQLAAHPDTLKSEIYANGKIEQLKK